MLKIGVQTQNVIYDNNPAEGFQMLREVGFDCVDFSLHGYLKNTDLYEGRRNDFFDKSNNDLELYFTPHKRAAELNNITIHQMHMPYPILNPRVDNELNEYLINVVAPKSLQLCAFFNCQYIVVHGLKLIRFTGSEETEWQYTENILGRFAPIAKELGITICIENLYTNIGGHLIESTGCNAKKSAERIDRFNDRYGAEVLGFCLDTGHANLVGLPFEDFIKTLGQRLKVLHVHDNDGIRDLHQIPFVFSRARENSSSTDWPGFISGLRSIHFDKVLNFETAPVLNSFPPELKLDALKFIVTIGKYFSHQIEL